MPRDTAGQITYRDADAGLRFQTSPPVCNICHRQITRQNFGMTCLEIHGRTGEQFEHIECTACTLIRESGSPLRAFLHRHHL
jgi:hypothetical protein